jgi:predicted amidohydrolase
MKIALLQYSPIWENKEKSKQKIKGMIESVKEKFDVLLLPEMSLTGFSMNTNLISETIYGDSFNFFSNLALEKKIDILAGFVEKSKSKPFNTLIHINKNGNLIKLYRKIHPFSYAKEDKYFNAGKRPAISKFGKWKIGLSICYDLRFPELYRKYAKKRVHLIVNIANWPDTRIEHWRALLKARAIENQCYMIGVNRVGKDIKLNYNGFSSVFDPMGNEICSSVDQETILIAEIDKNFVTEIRNNLPFLDDMKLI